MRPTRPQILFSALLAVLMVGTGALLMPVDHTDPPPAAVGH